MFLNLFEGLKRKEVSVMKSYKLSMVCFLSCWLILFYLPFIASAAEFPNPKTYVPTLNQIEKHKAPYDDPRPYVKEFGPKQIVPKEFMSKLVFDEGKMKALWAELVGFRAPDVVEKIAPEIKPGKYTYKDLEKYPGFKDLMWPEMYNRIKPGGPPHGGNIPEFEIVPTQQCYFSLPIAEATKKNLGKAKLDKDGYLVWETWEGGYPFPKPTEPFKAQQIMFNLEKRYLAWDGNMYIAARLRGYTKNLKMDFDGAYEVLQVKLAGRVLLPPYGWYDERAKKRGEFRHFILGFTAPRDIAGATQSALYFLDPNKADQVMMYLPSLRRVRKLTSTDTQDPVMGMDNIYDDNEGFMQRLSPSRYPYKYELIAEREYLVPAHVYDGSNYISSKGLELRNMKFERRPIYVVKLTQLDKNYVYSYRILYIDKETFNYYHLENYDQKGRLYRTWDINYCFHEDMGMSSWLGSILVSKDYVDSHSTVFQNFQLPAVWDREDVNLDGYIKQK